MSEDIEAAIDDLESAEEFFLITVDGRDGVNTHLGGADDPDPSTIALLTVSGRNALEGLEQMAIQEADGRGEVGDVDIDEALEGPEGPGYE